jgi:hypothetical protein
LAQRLSSRKRTNHLSLILSLENNQRSAAKSSGDHQAPWALTET